MRKLRGTLNVACFEEAFEDAQHVHIVMEWCHGGELHHRIGDKHYSERTVRPPAARRSARAATGSSMRGFCMLSRTSRKLVVCTCCLYVKLGTARRTPSVCKHACAVVKAVCC